MSMAGIMPREHGTWAMLLVPWIVGAGIGGRFDAAQVVLGLGLVLLFLAHNQLLVAVRERRGARSDRALQGTAIRRMLVLGIPGLVAIAGLIIPGRAGLLLLAPAAAIAAAAAVALVRARRDHAVAGQVLAAATLALSAPAAYHVATGSWDRIAVAVWAVNFLFFLGAVAYVQLRIDALRARGVGGVIDRARFAARVLLLDVAIVVAAWLALRFGGLAPLALVAFAPVAVHTIVGVLRLNHPVRFKRLGFAALGHALLFAALVIPLSR